MKEVRRIEIDKVRSMCIRNDYYTEGTCEEYAEMFKLCETVNPSTEMFEVIATNIIEHSDVQELVERTGLPVRGVVQCIMFELINDCTTVLLFEDDEEYRAYL